MSAATDACQRAIRDRDRARAIAVALEAENAALRALLEGES